MPLKLNSVQWNHSFASYFDSNKRLFSACSLNNNRPIRFTFSQLTHKKWVILLICISCNQCLWDHIWSHEVDLTIKADQSVHLEWLFFPFNYLKVFIREKYGLIKVIWITGLARYCHYLLICHRWPVFGNAYVFNVSRDY